MPNKVRPPGGDGGPRQEIEKEAAQPNNRSTEPTQEPRSSGECLPDWLRRHVGPGRDWTPPAPAPNRLATPKNDNWRHLWDASCAPSPSGTWPTSFTSLCALSSAAPAFAASRTSTPEKRVSRRGLAHRPANTPAQVNERKSKHEL
jgi:hypothetical protein